MRFWLTMLAALAVQTHGLANADSGQAALIRLTDRQHASGTVADSPGAGHLAWQHPAFTKPFAFPLQAVVSVSFPSAPQPAASEGQFGFQLVGGGLFYGDLIEVSDDALRIRTSTFGEVSLHRDRVQQIFRWRSGADRLYFGPRSDDDWQRHPADAWSDVGGVLATSIAGASVVGDISLPDQAVIELRIAWDDTPNFTLSLGVDPQEAAITNAFSGFRIEVWDEELILLRELEGTADVASIGSVNTVPGNVELSILLDQEHQRAMVLGAAGRVVADLNLSADTPEKALAGFRLENIRGSVRLESMTVRAGNPEMFERAGQTGTLVALEDGSSFDAPLESVAEQGSVLVFAGPDQLRRVPADQVVRMVMQSLSASATDADQAQAAERPVQLSIVTHSGMRLVGELQQIQQQQMRLISDALPEPVEIAISEIRDIVVLNQRPVEPTVANEDKMPRVRSGQLMATDTTLQGSFVDGTADGNASCFVFAPSLANGSSPLRRDAAAEMVYRSAPKRADLLAARQHLQGVRVQRVVRNVDGAQQIFFSVPTPGHSNPSIGPFQRTLHLRTGDTVQCEVVSSDDAGLHIRCNGDIEAHVPHEQVRAVQLKSLGGEAVAEEKKARLLTVPRMRRENPPTHLLVSVDGDYLRGRLTRMDADQLTIETRLEEQQIPRDLVAQIIWLHKDEIRAPEGEPNDDEPPQINDFHGRVQVVRGDGTRLSFVADTLREGVVTGTHEFLGSCSQDLASVDRLLFGRRIQSQSGDLPFASWRLTHAPDPMVFRNSDFGDPGGGPSGKTSELVGQAAPDFELQLLSGENYRLSDHHGDVVVLDFWASWCGPCMQAMPHLDQMIGELDRPDLQLVAINLQESPQRIRQALERLQLDFVVAMDETGEIAERYQATAIPQTVVIDRQGRVSHLFVGGGPRTLEPLRAAILDALDVAAEN